MRASTGLSLLSLLCVAACTPKGEPAPEAEAKSEPGIEARSEGTPCDLDKLGSLAQSLSAAGADQQVQLVAEGLLSACEGGLYPLTEHHLRDALTPQDPEAAFQQDTQFIAARLRICPEADELDERMRRLSSAQERGAMIFETCKFQRFGLVRASEIGERGGPSWLTWTTYAMMLQDGASPEVAKTISRALIQLEEVLFTPVFIRLLEDQQLAKVDVLDPIPEGTPLYVSMGELHFEDRTIATLDEGKLSEADVKDHLIMGLYDSLQEEVDKGRQIAESRDEEWDGRVVLVLDHRLPFGTLVDVIYTTGKAEYSDYSVVVEPAYPLRRAIHITPPKFGIGEAQAPSAKVFILEDGYRLTQPGQEPVTIDKLDPAGTQAEAWDLAGLAKLAGSVDPEVVSAVVSGENSISVGVLLATYAALLGPQCKQAEAEGCRFPVLKIEAGAG